MNKYNQAVRKHFKFARAYNDKHVDGSRRLAYIFPEPKRGGYATAVKNVQKALDSSGLPGQVKLIDGKGYLRFLGFDELKLVIYLPVS